MTKYEQSTDFDATSASFPASFINSATIDTIKSNAEVIVQTPIKVANWSPSDPNGKEPLLDTLQVTNTANIERIRGNGNIVIQIPIFIIDVIAIDDREQQGQHLTAGQWINTAGAGAIEGNDNFILQIPILLASDFVSQQNFSQIGNRASKRLVRGRRNIVIQTPVQLAPDSF